MEKEGGGNAKKGKQKGEEGKENDRKKKEMPERQIKLISEVAVIQITHD